MVEELEWRLRRVVAEKVMEAERAVAEQVAEEVVESEERMRLEENGGSCGTRGRG